MPSLQLLQLTDRGRGLLASRRSVGSDHSLTRQVPSFNFLSPFLPIAFLTVLTCAPPTRRTLAVVSGAVLAGGALAYARSSQSQRRRRSEANHGGEASALATNGDGAGGGLAAAKKKRSGLKSLHFLAAILLKKIGPSGTRYLLGLVLTAVGSAIFL